MVYDEGRCCVWGRRGYTLEERVFRDGEAVLTWRRGYGCGRSMPGGYGSVSGWGVLLFVGAIEVH